jgi:Protein of unknown function (DUF1553)/Protein of unknown function (DUF1549)/Planctomycete cytochrome C
MSKLYSFSILTLLSVLVSSASAGQKTKQAGMDFFEKNIRPVLIEQCYKCHSQDAQKAGKLKGELLLDSRAGVLKGGENGHILNLAKPAQSRLLKALRHDGEVRMPPKKRLPESVVRDFATWIAMGAPDPREGGIISNKQFDLDKVRKEHWAFQPLRNGSRPKVKNVDWVKTPLDAFILSKLESTGVQPAPAVDPATLLRRVYFDLIGLPPTPKEQQAFLRDPSDAAYEKVVDDLLQRPQYGERWGRHWLDVARYAETLGFEHDWVIDAFNADMPYDQFLTEQLAGDEVKNTTLRSHIATSFLRLGTYESNAADHTNARYAHLDDIVSTVSMAFLGLTVQCARCHDHKFEPVSQEDYYRMLAVFEPLQTIEREGKVQAFEIGTAHDRAVHAQQTSAWQKKLDGLYQPLNQLRLTVLERSRKELLLDKKLNEKQFEETLLALKSPSEKRTKQHADLLLITNARAKVLDEALKQFVSSSEKAELQSCLDAINEQMKKQPQSFLAHVYRESGVPDTWLFARGEVSRKVRIVLPGAPGVMGGQDFPEPKKKRFADTSGRRLWLAEWMTNQAQPLLARVMVNRIWQQHFGRGFVDDANNLGLSGGSPSHPELLDWLANDLVAHGWRLKRMHRLIVLSSTYRLASKHPHQADPDGKLFARWLPRHLEAEAVRDAMLSASGKLNLAMGGPSIHPPFKEKSFGAGVGGGGGWKQSDEKEASRRSVYIFAKRLVPLPMLDVLGAPDSSASAASRTVATTSVQALLLLNGEFSTQQARFLADRLQREAGPDAEARIRLAYALVFCRAPGAEEMRDLVIFLQQHPRAGTDEALVRLCLVLLNTNEFAYLN